MTRALVSSLFALVLGGALHAQLPSMTLPVSGVLQDSGGAPATGPVNLTFRLYDLPSGGTPLWQETRGGVMLDTSGRYRVRLGQSMPLTPALFATPDRWMGIEVDSDGEMTPRIALSPVPSAHEAAQLGGEPAASYALAAELSDQDPMTTPVHYDDLVGAPTPGGGGLGGTLAQTRFCQVVLVDTTQVTVPAGRLWQVVAVLPTISYIRSTQPQFFDVVVNGSTISVGHTGWGNTSQSSNSAAYAAGMHGAPMPFLLPAGTTVQAAGTTGLLCVLELDPAAGDTLQLAGALLVGSTPQTVPAGKTWEVTSILPAIPYQRSTQPAQYEVTVNGSSYAVGHSGWGNTSQSSNSAAYSAEMRGQTLPFWLPAGATLAAGGNVTFVTVTEYDVIP